MTGGWGGEDPPGVVFTYAPGRAGENAAKILQGFDGILQLDGYSGYNRLTRPSRKGGDPIRVAHCWAHPAEMGAAVAQPRCPATNPLPARHFHRRLPGGALCDPGGGGAKPVAERDFAPDRGMAAGI